MIYRRKPAISTDVLEITDHTAPRRWRAATLWLVGLLALAATLLLCFVSYGATVALAVGLTSFTVGYMLIMGRWASHHNDRRNF